MADENTLGSKVSLDVTDFKTGVSQLTASIKSIEAGFRASAAVMGNWSSSTNGLQERTTSLSQKLDLQKQKLNILHEEYDKVVKSSGATSSAAESLANKMFSAEKAITSTEKDLAKYREQLNSVKKSEEEATNPLSKMKTSFLQMAEQSKKSTSSMKEHFGSLKSTIAGAVAGIGLSLGVTGLAKSIYGVAESASDLVEAQNVVENTFKKSSQAVENWTNTTAKSAGIGKTAATQMVGAMGAMMQSSGIAEKASSSMSEKLVQLTGDLSSFYNVGTSDMWEKIRAGISGETKPLKDLGINMSEANLSAFALSEGIKTAYNKMSQSEQVTLRYNYLLSVTKNAQGDFARTSATSMANQSRIFQMNIAAMKQTVGASFLPMINQMFNAVNPFIQQAIPKISAGVQSLVNNIKAHKDEIINSVKGAISVVQNAFNFVTTHGDLVKGAVIGIATAVGVWKTAMLAANTVSTIHNALTALGIIKSGAAATAKGVETAATVANNTATSGGTIAIIAHNAALVASKVAMAAATAAQWLFNAALNANPIGIVITLIAGLVAAMVVLFNNNKGFHDWVVNAWNTIKNLAGTVGNGIKDAFVGAWNGIKSAWSAVTGFFSGIWDKIVSTFKPDLITNAFKSAWDGIKGAWNGAAGWFGNVWNSIKGHFKPDMISNGFKSAWSGVQGAWHGAGEWFGGIWQSIKDGFSKLNPIQWGKDLIDGIASGIRSAADHVKTAVGNVAQNIRSFLHFSRPDTGPLADYETWMPDMMSGLAESIAKSKYKVSQAIQGLSTDMSIGVKAQMQPAYAGAYAPQPTTVQNNVSLPKYLYATINLPGGKAWEAIVPIVGSSLNKNATDSKMGRT